MANDEPVETPDDYFILGWRLSTRIFQKPEHIADVLRRFGPRSPSTLRKIIQELDIVVKEYLAACKKKPPLKFAEADPRLVRLEKWLGKAQREWNGLRPLHPAFYTLRVQMIPQNERKEKVQVATATTDLGLVTTNLLEIVRRLRDSKRYSAALRLPDGKSYERAFLWEPFLRLMKDHGVKPGQHGSFLGAIKSLHLALKIDPPSKDAVNQMRHDLRQSKRPKRRKGYAAAKKRPHA